YNDVTVRVTDDPQWSTNDKFDAVLIVGDRIEIVGEFSRETPDTVETVLNQLLKTTTRTERAGFVLAETAARITIRTADGVVTVPKADIIEQETLDDDTLRIVYTETSTVVGVVTAINGDVYHLRTADEETATFDVARVLEREVIEVVDCDPATDLNCHPGAIVTIQREGNSLAGPLSTLSNTHVKIILPSGDIHEVRRLDIEYFIVATLTRAFNAGAAERIVADGDSVRVGYYQTAGTEDYLGTLNDGAAQNIPLVYSAGEATVELVAFDDLDTLLEATASGAVDGLIYVAPGPEHTAFDTWITDHPDAAVAEATTTVCEAGCVVQIKLEDDEITGRIAEETDTEITLVTTEAAFIEVDEDTVIEERRMDAKVCALNNISGCDEGIFVTLRITVLAYMLALTIGLIVGVLRLPTNPTTIFSKLVQTVITTISTLYVEIVRGIPLLVILLYAGFVVAPELRKHTLVIPGVIEAVLDAVLMVLNVPFWLWNQLGIVNIGDLGSFPGEITLDLQAQEQAIAGLAFGYGAFIAEIFRAGIQSIGRGQMEAARSLGMSYPQAMRHVVLPQAIRVVLPPLGNDFIAMLKDSSLVAILAIPDLLQTGKLYISRTFDAFPGYNTIAVLYLLMTLFLSTLVRIIERRTRLPG
ncbi:MAG: amino acid ABC transporter permease, partial [Anaerolineae bacterium]|nr:amino acid ABC transporter permease [Anaerolineae bacterium]